ncbi:MAG: ATP-dependent helicase C-terminal domain-containing protein, partial [Devosiaceae bacterium]
RKALGPSIAVHTLYGAVSRKAQEAALAADDAGRRKVVIASSIAETSLTIPGVRFVIDSGLSRRPIYDPVRGTTRLETKPASRASIDQRRGRAGRTAPGHCVRLWRREEEGGRPTQDRPEILDADLAGLRLEMAAWGAVTPDSLPFLDAPPARAWQEAGKLLASLSALDDKHHITSLGKRMAVRPIHPRLAAMLDQADPIQASDAAWAAVVAGELTERGSVDAVERLQSALADRHQSKTLRNLHTRFLGKRRPGVPPSRESLALHLLRAYPDRVAKRQKDDGKRAIYKLAQGMQAALELYHPLAQNTFILALDLGGGRKSGAARLADIRLGLPLDDVLVRQVLAGQLARVEVSQFDPLNWSEKVRQETRLGELALAEEARPRRAGLDAISAIGKYLRAQGISALVPADSKGGALISRYQAFFQAQGAPEALMDRVDLWLPALLQLTQAPPFVAPVIQQCFASALTWEERQAFDQQWPATIQLGKDRKLPIAYDHPAGPAISVRPHWLYGVDVHPTFGPDGTAILIEMLSPAQRPIALTADLPAFWRAGWKDVRKEMRARYPKHPWPEEPWTV